MFLILAVLGCVGGSDGNKTADGPSHDPAKGDPEVSTRQVELPPGQAVTRSCFGFVGDKDPFTGGSFRTSSAPSPAPPPSSAPMPITAPKPTAAAGPSKGRGRSLGVGASGAGARPKSDAAPAAEAAAPAAAMPMEVAQGGASTSASDGGGGLFSTADSTTATPSTPKASPDPAAAEPTAAARQQGEKKSEQQRSVSRRGETEREEAKPADEEASIQNQGPSVEWGAVTWLSNDDSMSLASAQRVLFAVKDNVPFRASEVRPHELLNYFSFTAEPVEEGQLFSVTGDAVQTAPDTLTLALAVQGAKPEHTPLDMTVVVDVSGSMSAEGRMDYVKRGLNKMSEQLQRGDRVNLVLFDHEVCTPLEDYVQGRDAPSVLSDAIDAMRPRGSTDLNKGLKEAYRLANMGALSDASHARNHRVMVLTDAMLNTGDVDPNTVSEVAKAYETNGVRLTGVGVGREFNDKMLDMLTEKGKGAYVYLGSEAVVDRILGVGFESLTRTIAHNVRFSLDLPDSLGMARFYGEESSSDPEDIQPINYYSGTKQVFLQDLKIRDGRIVGADDLKLSIHYQDAATGENRTFDWSRNVGQVLSADPRNVKKARALMAWSDFLLARAMGNNPCGAPLDEYKRRLEGLSDDAEIGYVSSLSGPLCGVDLGAPSSAVGVAWRVRVDSDVPIAEVELACKSGKQVEKLSGSDTVARFNATPGDCVLTLQGAVPMTASVSVPSTGGEARCLVRSGRIDCG